MLLKVTQMKKRERDAVVKVDSELLGKIEEFIKKNKFLYANKKHVVNLAIIEFLKTSKTSVFERHRQFPISEKRGKKKI